MATRAEKDADPMKAWRDTLRTMMREYARHDPKFWARTAKYALGEMNYEERKRLTKKLAEKKRLHREAMMKAQNEKPWEFSQEVQDAAVLRQLYHRLDDGPRGMDFALEVRKLVNRWIKSERDYEKRLAAGENICKASSEGENPCWGCRRSMKMRYLTPFRSGFYCDECLVEYKERLAHRAKLRLELLSERAKQTPSLREACAIHDVAMAFSE